jgi:hypothetical protein
MNLDSSYDQLERGDGTAMPSRDANGRGGLGVAERARVPPQLYCIVRRKRRRIARSHKLAKIPIVRPSVPDENPDALRAGFEFISGTDEGLDDKCVQLIVRCRICQVFPPCTDSITR